MAVSLKNLKKKLDPDELLRNVIEEARRQQQAAQPVAAPVSTPSMPNPIRIALPPQEPPVVALETPVSQIQQTAIAPTPQQDTQVPNALRNIIAEIINANPVIPNVLPQQPQQIAPQQTVAPTSSVSANQPPVDANLGSGSSEVSPVANQQPAAPALDLDQLVNAPLNTAGSYGEGQVYDIQKRLQKLKGYLTDGQIDTQTYLKYSAPLVQQGTTITRQIAGSGQKQAQAVMPAWEALEREGYIRNDGNGKWSPLVPLSEQEYATLPDASKPTAEQIEKGVVPADALPGDIALNTTIKSEQDKQADLAKQAEEEAIKRQQDTENQLQNIYKDFLSSTEQRYNQAYGDIESNLNKRRDNLLEDLTTGPGGNSLRNYYNNLGLLNSGAFNQGLANNALAIQQQTESDLLQAQLEKYRALQDAQQQGTNAIAQFGLGSNEQLQNIANQGYNVLSNLGIGGVERKFSLQDYFNDAFQNEVQFNREKSLSEDLAHRQGKSANTGALYGLGGTLLGSFAGPLGAAAGGAIGNYFGSRGASGSAGSYSALPALQQRYASRNRLSFYGA